MNANRSLFIKPKAQSSFALLVLPCLVCMALGFGCASQNIARNTVGSSTTNAPVEVTVHVQVVATNEVTVVTRTKNKSMHPIVFHLDAMPGNRPSSFVIEAYTLGPTNLILPEFQGPMGNWVSGDFVLEPGESVEGKVNPHYFFNIAGDLSKSDLILSWRWRFKDAVKEYAGGLIPDEISGVVLLPQGPSATVSGNTPASEAQPLQVRVTGQLASGHIAPVVWFSGKTSMGRIVPLHIEVRNATTQAIALRGEKLPWNSREFHVLWGAFGAGFRFDRSRPARPVGVEKVVLHPGKSIGGTVDVQVLEEEKVLPKLFWVWNLRNAIIDPNGQMPELLGGVVNNQ